MEEQILAQLEAVNVKMTEMDAKHLKLGQKLRPLVTEVEALKEFKTAGSAAEKKYKKKFKALQDGLKRLTDMQESQNVLSQAFDDLKAGIKKADSKRSPHGSPTKLLEMKRQMCSPGRAVCRNEEWKAQSKLPQKLAFQKAVSTEVKGALLGGIEFKDSDLMDPASVLQSVFIDESTVIEAPQAVPIHRQLLTVVPLPGVKQITVKRKTRPLEYVCKATAVANIGANAIVVDRIAGILVDADFNSIRVHNDTGGDLDTYETHLCTTAAATVATAPNGAGTLTFAASTLVAAVAIGDTLTFDYSEYIAEGQLKPKGRAVYADVTISIRVLAEWIEVSTQSLMWAGLLEASVNDDLMIDLAQNEEHQVLFGDATAGQYRGLLNDSSINTITWSALTAGTTRLDCLVHAIVAAELSSYNPTWLWLNPQDWRELVKSQGGDGQYIYAEAARTGEVPRMWGLQVWKSVMMTSGTALVGEQRSATIYDSMEGSIDVGTINDQFVKNTRTVLAEIWSASYVGHPSSVSKIVWDAAPA